MNPEIKAAIEKMANERSKLTLDVVLAGQHVALLSDIRKEDCITSAEYGYKLAEEKLEIAVKALKEVQSHLDVVTYNEPMRLAHVKISEALKELGE